MPSLASASESSDSDWESECVARDGESDSGSDRNRSARAHSPPPRHTASSRAAAKRMKDSAVYRGALAEIVVADHGYAADDEVAAAGVADGVADQAVDAGSSDARKVARESRRPALAAAAPAGSVKLSERAAQGTARACGSKAADLGGFGKPFRMPGPPVVCRTTGCGRSGRNQSNRHDTACCVLCTMSGGAEHTEECDGRSGVGPEPTAAAGGSGASSKSRARRSLPDARLRSVRTQQSDRHDPCAVIGARLGTGSYTRMSVTGHTASSRSPTPIRAPIPIPIPIPIRVQLRPPGANPDDSDSSIDIDSLSGAAGAARGKGASEEAKKVPCGRTDSGRRRGRGRRRCEWRRGPSGGRGVPRRRDHGARVTDVGSGGGGAAGA